MSLDERKQKIPMENRRKSVTVSINVDTEQGRAEKKVHENGTNWISVDFTKAMRIAWNWDDLLQDATASEANLNLVMAGLVLSNEVELAARKGEAVLRQLGFDKIQSDYYRLSTETRNEISNPARTFGYNFLNYQMKKQTNIFVVKISDKAPDQITDKEKVTGGTDMSRHKTDERFQKPGYRRSITYGC